MTTPQARMPDFRHGSRMDTFGFNIAVPVRGRCFTPVFSAQSAILRIWNGDHHRGGGKFIRTQPS